MINITFRDSFLNCLVTKHTDTRYARFPHKNLKETSKCNFKHLVPGTCYRKRLKWSKVVSVLQGKLFHLAVTFRGCCLFVSWSKT